MSLKAFANTTAIIPACLYKTHQSRKHFRLIYCFVLRARKNHIHWFIYIHYILSSFKYRMYYSISQFSFCVGLTGGRGKVHRAVLYYIRRNNIMVDVNHHFSSSPVPHCNFSCFSIVISIGNISIRDNICVVCTHAL